jgi:hypothetical protein
MRRPWRHFGVAVSVAAVLVLGATATATPAGAWTLSGQEQIASLTQGQGLATVRAADGTTHLFYDGTLSVPADKTAAGWSHVGDPDSAEGYVFQPYQAASSSTAAKLFHVIAPGGAESDFIHHDIAGEEYNNSFAAVSPDSQWMVSGEWDHMTRLLVMATPVLNPAATDTAADLPITGEVQLDATVTDVQGCTFESTASLICSSDDPIAEHGFDRKAILRVELPHALDGTTIAGHVTEVFPAPELSTCPMTAPGSWPDDFEVEGVDVNRWTGELRVEVIPPGICGITGDVYVYAADAVAPTTTTTVSVPSTTPTPNAVAPVAIVAVPTFTG